MASDVCRICLRKSTESIPIFETYLGGKLVSEIIWITFGVELSSSNYLSNHICQYCVLKIDFLYSFYQELIECQSHLCRLREIDEIDNCSQRKLTVGPKHGSDNLFQTARRLEEAIADDSLLESMAVKPINNGINPLDNVNIEKKSCNDETESKDLDDVKSVTDPYPKEVITEDRKSLIYAFEKLKKRGRIKKRIVKQITNKCYICDTITDNQDLLELHLINHTDMLPFRCDQCSTESNKIEIKTLLSLNKHLESHLFKYVCSNCPLRFRSYHSWHHHNRNVHMKDYLYTCNICKKKFIELRNFGEHMRSHKNFKEKQYECKICRKTYQTKAVLVRHERIHKQERPYECPFCDVAFKDKSNLQQHKRRHIQLMGGS
ncbi:zinc finger protein 888-like [Toxorhynchites rutilus septentrionalis]|uniref:zinc finger protein 888-like n=1 Tax=Toxorhynchites rutilus septentrionalis TaxID=329112 RepID=UPI0024784D71|nr:zinc finger protein 888-like [Toxorhynchites rutilus septentrionalis]